MIPPYSAASPNKPDAMHDALLIAENAGFSSDKINAEGNEVLRDNENKVFSCLTEGRATDLPDSICK